MIDGPGSSETLEHPRVSQRRDGKGRSQRVSFIALGGFISSAAALLRAYAIRTNQEARRTGRQILWGVAFLILAGFLSLLAVGVILTTAILALSLILTPWQAALVVFLTVALITMLLVRTGVRLLQYRRLMALKGAFLNDLRGLWKHHFG